MDEQTKELMDQFEKLYAITAAQMHTGKEINDKTYNNDDFNNIMTFREFKEKYGKEFSLKENSEHKNDQEESKLNNYYMIPITINSKHRVGNVTLNTEKAYVLTDNNGYGLYTFHMDTKLVSMTSELIEQRKLLKKRYQHLIDKGKIKEKDLDEAFKKVADINDINDVNEELTNLDIDFDNLQKMLDDEILSAHKLDEMPMDLYDLAKEKEEQEKQKENGNDELDDDKNSEGDKSNTQKTKIGIRAEEMGVDEEFLRNFMRIHMCNLSNISYREINDPRRLRDDIGVPMEQTQGKKIIAIRLRMPTRPNEYYLIDTESGEYIRPENNKYYEYENIVEAEDYFKYEIPDDDGKDWAYAVGSSMTEETNYPEMTTIDDDGNVKTKKYINNGRKQDLTKSDREKYLEEVEETNIILSACINEYQRDCTIENWKKVNAALRHRIMVDDKYSVLENQREVTKDSVLNIVDRTVDTIKDNKREKESKDDKIKDNGKSDDEVLKDIKKQNEKNEEDDFYERGRGPYYH